MKKSYVYILDGKQLYVLYIFCCFSPVGVICGVAND